MVPFLQFIRVPDLFYETHKERLPKYVTIEDNFGNIFPGETWIISSEYVVIETTVRNFFKIYTYRFFAIVRLTYLSNGRFKLFVPDNTYYFRDHSPIPGLLPFNYKGPDIWGKFDSVGMYEYDGFVRNNRCTRISRKKAIEEEEEEAYRKHLEELFEEESEEAERSDDSFDSESLPLLPSIRSFKLCSGAKEIRSRTNRYILTNGLQVSSRSRKNLTISDW